MVDDEDLCELFQAGVTDDSGTIDYEQFIAAMLDSDRVARRQDAVRQSFDKLDCDGERPGRRQGRHCRRCWAAPAAWHGGRLPQRLPVAAPWPAGRACGCTARRAPTPRRAAPCRATPAGDGYITVEDLCRLLPSTRRSLDLARSMVQEVDKNQDGRVDYQEWAARAACLAAPPACLPQDVPRPPPGSPRPEASRPGTARALLTPRPAPNPRRFADMMCAPEPRASIGSDPRRRSLNGDPRRRSLGGDPRRRSLSGPGGPASEAAPLGLQSIDERASMEASRKASIDVGSAISGGGLVPVL